jgi:2-polyprenyl-3-methyl-5-hydroxy-6-metoxy-1,4-benzoquinol methylase
MIPFLDHALRRGWRMLAGAARGRAAESAQVATDPEASPRAGGHEPVPPPDATAPDGRPFPTPDLHYLVSGVRDLDHAAFWAIGRRCADLIIEVLKKHGVDIDEREAILDFGCGCGRIIRHFHSLTRAKVYGTDYNLQLVDWCRRHLPFAEFEVNQLHPPLVYRDRAFDVIYAFSVFTHLPEPLQRAWLAELTRVLKPGGHLLLTTQGAAYARAYLPQPEQRRFDTGHLVVLNQEQAGRNACLAYHPAEYVTGTLVKGLEVVDFISGEVIDLSRHLIAQDTHVLGKPA